jgi:hypothetical protein
MLTMPGSSSYLRNAIGVHLSRKLTAIDSVRISSTSWDVGASTKVHAVGVGQQKSFTPSYLSCLRMNLQVALKQWMCTVKQRECHKIPPPPYA